jgi:hypothetical protein
MRRPVDERLLNWRPDPLGATARSPRFESDSTDAEHGPQGVRGIEPREIRLLNGQAKRHGDVGMVEPTGADVGNTITWIDTSTWD